MTRDAYIAKTVDKLEKLNYNGICNWCTGVGKTTLGIEAIRKIEKKGKHSFIVLSPSPEINKQWENKIKQSFPKHLIERIILKTPQQILGTETRYIVDMLIVDELHEFTTDERLTLIDKTKIKFEYFLGLTASANKPDFRKILKFHSIVDIVTKEQARENKWISDVVEYSLGLELTKKEQDTYNKVSETISKLMPKFNNDLDLVNKILLGGKDKHGKYYSGLQFANALAFKHGWKNDLNFNFPQHKEIDQLWNPSTLIGQASNLTNCIRIRKDILYNANSKKETILTLVTKFNKVKTIVFAESTIFCDKVASLLTLNNHKVSLYHSKLKTVYETSEKTKKLIKKGAVRLKKEAIQNISTGKTRILVTGKSFDTGLDIPDIRFILTASGTQSFVQKEQRDGRGIRKEENIDLPVLLVNLYIKDTQDEVWLKNRLKNNNNNIFVTSVEDITYTPPANIEFSTLDL